ncbi:MAG: tetraether lipid synthase Tes [Thermoproteota archaeon]
MKFVKKTHSLCPECLSVIEADLVEEDGKLLMKKRCEKHGEYEDIYWSSYEDYVKAMRWYVEGTKLTNPRTKSSNDCPYDCGICENHKSHTVLAIIDLTNRCNLNCPICFASANNPNVPYIYEVSTEQVKEMIDNLASNSPIQPKGLQFSGGEPTLRDDLPELITYAKNKGIDHIEVNTNGIRLAKDLEYFNSLKKAGMSSLYLSFEGVTPKPYVINKGIDLLDMKLKVLENSRKIGLDSIILVPTVAKEVNDDQLGDIIKFAVKNKDIVRCVNFQPISLAGRVATGDRLRMRITIPEVLELIEQQTAGQIKKDDFYTCPTVVPLARAIGSIKGKMYPEFSNHPACGMATFIFVEDEDIIPITRYVEIEKFMQAMNGVWEAAKEGKKTKAKLKLVGSLRHVRFGILRDLLGDIFKEGSYEALGKLMRRTIMIGIMHFMDLYNFDLERVQMCNIHYALPDGTIRPFCTYNSVHRPVVEEKFGTPKKR